eukprot:3378608-Pyramimonas_sp.AAC.1
MQRNATRCQAKPPVQRKATHNHVKQFLAIPSNSANAMSSNTKQCQAQLPVQRKATSSSAKQ